MTPAAAKQSDRPSQRARRAGLGGRSAFADRWSRGGVALVVLCLALYLPGVWSIPPVDRDESRFAQASAQMLASGTVEGWVVPRIQEKPRLNKPPMIYWLQAASAWLCGTEEKIHHSGTEDTERKTEKYGLNEKESIEGMTVRGEHASAPASPQPSGTGVPPVTSQPLPSSSSSSSSSSLGPLPTAGIWAYRLPSVLCAIVSALLTWRLGRRMVDPRAAWLGGALMAACVMQLWDARQARADQLLLTTTTATMFALWNIWNTRHRADAGGAARAAMFWLCLALGVMSKGPITPMVAGLTMLALSVTTGEWAWMKRLRPLMGVAIVLAVVMPWVGLVMHEIGAAKYLALIYDETLGRSVSAKEGHWGPPGYHTVLLAVMFWPGSLLTLAAVIRAVKNSKFTTEAQRARREEEKRGNWFLRAQAVVRLNGSRVETFLLCWIVPAWVVFELVGTKLPHYTLPMYPAIALLSARAVFAAETGKLAGAQDFGAKIGWAVWILIGVVLVLMLPVARESALHDMADHVRRWADANAKSTPELDRFTLLGALRALAPFLILAVILPIALVRRLQRGRFVRAQSESIFQVVIISALVFQGMLPATPYFWPTAMTIRSVRLIDPAGARQLATVGYGEDSLVFMTRGRIARLTAEQLPAWFDDNPRGLAIIAKPHDDLVDSYRVLGFVRAFNYAKGDWVELSIVERSHGDG
jgi:4-amino-4-deoxy-L-arabinose transferase-like glycosyltransferase